MAALTPQSNHTPARTYTANGVNAAGDPFTIEEAPPPQPQQQHQQQQQQQQQQLQQPPAPTYSRHSSFDTQLFAHNHPSSSPGQAKRTLEERLSETDRRIQETSKLGTTLVQQRSTLAQRIREVEMQGQGNQITPELREKLKQVEKEYQDVGRHSLKSIQGPRTGSPAVGESSNAVGIDGRNTASPTKFSSQATDSPSKLHVSRKQRNQASNNDVLDIELATEINASLLGQVRHLQTALAERDDALKTISAEKSKLESNVEGYTQRFKHLDDNEQRYKDENWNLETQLQELQTIQREASSREAKLQQALSATTVQHSTVLRELDDLKQSHGKLSEDHALNRKTHESELAALRKNVNLGDSDKAALQRKLDEVTQQNQELARGLAHGLRAQDASPTPDHDLSLDEDSLLLSEREGSPPPSPTKGNHRHSMLESETLKSSLNHAHRMIQSLKGNVQREKVEKNDLKRMLQEARDELELQRAEPDGKRARSKSQHSTARGSSKTAGAGLGAARNSKTDIMNDPVLNDPAWEDHNDSPNTREASNSGSKSMTTPTTASTPLIVDSSDAYQTANETDGFETANERETTDNDAFETGAEDLAGASTDELTETEGIGRNETIRGKRPAPLSTASLAASKAGKRNSVQSTASTSDDNDDDDSNEKALHTPIQGQPQRFRVKMNRNSRRSRTGSALIDSNPSTAQNSPASLINGPNDMGQSLAAELEGFSGDEDGTPSKGSISSPRSTQSLRRSLNDKRSSRSLKSVSQPGTPGFKPSTFVDDDAPPVPKIPTVDSGTMTEPWQPSLPSAGDESQSSAAPPSSKSGFLPTAAAASITSRIFGSSPSTPQNKNMSQAAGDSIPGSTSTSKSTPPRPVWDQPLNMFTGSIPGMGQSAGSTPLSSRTTSGQVRDVTTEQNTQGTPQSGRVLKEAAAPSPPAAPLSLSMIQTVETTPIALASPVPHHASHDSRQSVSTIIPAKTRTHQPQESTSSGGLLGSVFGWRRSTSGTPTPQQGADQEEREEAAISRDNVSTGTTGNKEEQSPPQQQEAFVDAVEGSPARLPVKSTENVPTKQRTPAYTSESSQTMLSSEHINQLLAAKNVLSAAYQSSPPPPMPPLASIGAVSPPLTTPQQQQFKPEVRIPEGSTTSSGGATHAKSYKDLLGQGVKRPTSVSSMRSRTAQYPPLPPDHQEAIAAAAERSTQIMGPPLAPASAYPNASIRSRRASRPQTPSQQGLPSPAASRGGTTPRVGGRYSTARSQMSRRSSVSSFASELDERFNIRADGMPMASGFPSNTDPRMIQAITQTMIGEMMWKYTRKAGRGAMSNTRHRRFFWVHPYTRTLYWSDHDPATANRAELKSKSVAIEAVRVETDDNPMPPGLHRKSLIIITPGRSVKFTAQTSQRHQTWFNALSYLLLRTGGDGAAAGGGELTDADVQEFNPPMGDNRRSTRSRISMSSFRSNSAADRTLQDSLGSRMSSNNYNNTGHTQTLPRTAESEYERSITGGSIRRRISRSLSRKSVGRRASRAATSREAPESEEQQPTAGDNSTLQTSAGAPRISTSRRSSVSSNNKPLHASIGSRISNYWKPANNPDQTLPNRDSVRSRASRTESITEPGVLEGGRSVISLDRNDSAEDVRRVIENREASGDLENVRACCDGSHDVANLRSSSAAGGRLHSHADSLSSQRSSSQAAYTRA